MDTTMGASLFGLIASNTITMTSGRVLCQTLPDNYEYFGQIIASYHSLHWTLGATCRDTVAVCVQN